MLERHGSDGGDVRGRGAIARPRAAAAARRARRWACAAWLLCSSSWLAHAADPDLHVKPEALLYFERGERAFRDGHFREAVELFHRADRIEPSPLLSFNVAQAYERMQDDTSALDAYREYLRRLPKAEDRLAISQRIAELELALQKRGIQQLSVFSVPAGATLLIDRVPRGVTPWTGELSPGTHLVGLRMSGYDDLDRDVSLPIRNSIDVTLSLQAAAAAPALQPAPSAALERPLPETLDRVPHSEPPAEELRTAPAWWTWALFGGSSALLLGAGAVELSRRALETDARHEARQIDYQHELDAIEGRQATARVLLGVGLGVAAAGGVSLYLDLSSHADSRDTAGLACGADACQLSLGRRW